VEKETLDPIEPRKHGEVVAAKKKTSVRVTQPNGHAFTVVLEDLRSQFRVFGEALQGLQQNMAQQFAEMNARFEQIDARFEQIDARFDRVEADIGVMKLAILENTRELADHGRQLREIRVALDNKVDRS
jgi:hypothetical protein